jgi:FAD/FMN-containing dehydrogenase
MSEHALRKRKLADGRPVNALLKRRAFAKLAASTVFGSLYALKSSWAQGETARASALSQLPDLDGELLFDDASRKAVSEDKGSYIHRSPIAVLRPKSVDDVSRMVTYANKHGLKIAMRGQGHSLYGQALVEGGIVIDSSTLSALRWKRNDVLDAQPGARWGEVAKETLARGLTPVVMPDSMLLTVGGTLSVGGIGETSYRDGAQVDHVLELNVVTGAGELVTCSPDQNSELFRMTLAGLGQCGLIVQARLPLVPAPKYVATRTLMYDDMDAFVADLGRLTTAAGLHTLNGGLTRDQDGSWRYALTGGIFVADENAGKRTPDWMAGLRYKSEAPLTTVTYWDYLNRRTARQTPSVVTSGPRPLPSLVLTLPATAVPAFLTHVSSTPEVSLGITIFEVSPKMAVRFAQPLYKVPTAPLIFELRMQRRASNENAPDHKQMLRANQALLERLFSAGGKVYPPFAPVLSQEQWRLQYGAETWPRFAAAKQRFDPTNVLTPGAGMF